MDADSGRRSSPIFNGHGSVDLWIAAAVSDIATALQADLDSSGRARLLVSGGSTPAPVYRALARLPLDWAKIGIALVDERWLPVAGPDSNARLIQENLLVDQAAAAHFEAMLVPDSRLQESVIAANRDFMPASVAVLGMGPDGHTASLFPHMRGLDQALSSDAAYVAVDASGCPGAGPWPQRISMTPAGLAKTSRRILLIRGEHKRLVLQRALDGTDLQELPVRFVISMPGAPLLVHWCP